MKFFLPFQLEKSMAQRIKIAQQTPQEGLSTRGVSSPNEPWWLQLLCLSLVVMRCQPLRRALCLNHKNQLVVLSISLAFRSGFFGNSILFVAA
ncbi:hypothetical protein L4F40_18655 [Vibrio paracholerae]|uniref:hypothetical protein n=2 Tax=Vibrio paracholerae TaxID=650003 RepID=UPI002095E417|nr:hypothetical protein [Vibrio paracholerae]MCO7017692.1 hypothetical protein [Vibrio paracholerae]